MGGVMGVEGADEEGGVRGSGREGGLQADGA